MCRARASVYRLSSVWATPEFNDGLEIIVEGVS